MIQPPEEHSQSNRLMKLLGGGVIIASGIIIGQTLVSHWSFIATYQYTWRPAAVLLSMICLVFSISCQALAWHFLISKTDPQIRLTRLTAWSIFTWSWLSRYIAGVIAPLGSRLLLGARAGAKTRSTVHAYYLETVLGMLGATLVTIGLWLIARGWDRNIIWLGLLLLISLAFTWPRILYPTLRRMAGAINRPNWQPVVQLSASEHVIGLGWYVVASVLGAFAFSFLVYGIIDLPLSRLVVVAAAFNTASLAGLLAFFSPTGIGVRETALAFLLSPYMPLPIATLLAIVARLWTIMGDIIFILASWIFITVVQKQRPLSAKK